jgi:hypothetical protein
LRVLADNQPGDKLTAKQHKAISALLSEPTIRKAAEQAGIPERTIYLWLKNGEFDTAYRAARRESVQQATARLQFASSAAVSVLCQLMAKDTVHASIRLSAAKTILELSIKTLELDDLAARLEALEQAYAAKL